MDLRALFLVLWGAMTIAPTGATAQDGTTALIYTFTTYCLGQPDGGPPSVRPKEAGYIQRPEDIQWDQWHNPNTGITVEQGERECIVTHPSKFTEEQHPIVQRWLKEQAKLFDLTHRSFRFESGNYFWLRGTSKKSEAPKWSISFSILTRPDGKGWVSMITAADRINHAARGGFVPLTRATPAPLSTD